jgi:argininosuccinate lyase
VTNSSDNKLWGGRFSEPLNEFVEQFTASISFDQRLYPQDIQGSIAHATMLADVGVLTQNERNTIVDGLESILEECHQGTIQWSVSLEDVHMNIESLLIKRIGDVGKKLHTGRSRNDQIATDIRLYLRDAIDTLVDRLQQLQNALITLAEQEAETIMPGFTHLQSAQPVTFGHHLLAWNQMIQRDESRLHDCRKRVNQMPLGAAALAGTSFPIKREITAKLLGFEGICANSLDAVSDRDFIIEFNAAASLIMMHLSRFSEELVLWMSQQFGFIDLPDAFCTGSSIMPQKKNPDVPELIRGKTGRVYGNLMAMLTLMKSQPLAYNKDNQEDKEPLFDTVDTLLGSLRSFVDLIPQITANRQRMREAASQGFSTATDLADYLVNQGLPFREAHEVVGQAVHYCVTQNTVLEDCPLEVLQKFSPRIKQSVYPVLTLDGSVAARNHFGGTAPEQVKAAAKHAREKLRSA